MKAVTNWRYRGRRTLDEKRAFSEAQRKRVNRRWAKAHDGKAVRRVRVVRVTIEDSTAPRTVIEAEQVETDDGRWSRFRLRGIRCRPVGERGLAAIIAAGMVHGA